MGVMSMRPFEYLAPASVSEALELLGAYGEKSVIMAGGTDLVPALNERLISTEYVIHIEKLDELRFIKEDESSVRIGPLVTTNEIIDSDIIRNSFTALAKAAEESAAPQVRNLATIGGNLGTASPAGDLNVALAALGARIKARDKNGEKEYSLEEFMVGPKKNILSKDQLITEIIVPKLPENSGSDFQKLGKRKAMSISIACAAAVVTLNAGKDTIVNAKVALGSLAPTMVFATKYTDALKGKRINSGDIKGMADLVRDSISPISDVRATAEYRCEIAGVLAARCVENSILNIVK